MSIKAWNDEQEQELIQLYTEENKKDVYELAEHFSKGYRSVISKLVQLKIYEKPVFEDDQKYLTVFTKIDKLNQKERAKLKREFPGSITLSNLKKNGHDRVHQIILQTIFGVDDEFKSKNEEEG